jgi:hypothetical protein
VARSNIVQIAEYLIISHFEPKQFLRSGSFLKNAFSTKTAIIYTLIKIIFATPKITNVLALNKITHFNEFPLGNCRHFELIAK